MPGTAVSFPLAMPVSVDTSFHTNVSTSRYPFWYGSDCVPILKNCSAISLRSESEWKERDLCPHALLPTQFSLVCKAEGFEILNQTPSKEAP